MIDTHSSRIEIPCHNEYCDDLKTAALHIRLVQMVRSSFAFPFKFEPTQSLLWNPDYDPECSKVVNCTQYILHNVHVVFNVFINE